jgi:hypothetical protein
VRCPHRDWREGIRRVGPVSLKPVNGAVGLVRVSYVRGAICTRCGAEADLDTEGKPLWPDYHTSAVTRT